MDFLDAKINQEDCTFHCTNKAGGGKKESHVKIKKRKKRQKRKIKT